MNKKISLTIVIPAYNEQRYLKACLDSIAEQTEKPDEVFVVDNNSTDTTSEIARQYDFVSLLSESRQGQVYAQATAFNRASGDILARIDADTILPPHWVAKMKKNFVDMPEVVAMTGGGAPYDVPLKKIGSAIFHIYHERLARLIVGHTLLWGSNCAFRSSAWPELKQTMHFRKDIWEDYDMSFHLNKLGKVIFVKTPKITCSFRTAHHPLLYQMRYQLRAIRTVALHASWPRTLLFALTWSSLVLLYPIIFVDRYLWKWKSASKKVNH